MVSMIFQPFQQFDDNRMHVSLHMKHQVSNLYLHNSEKYYACLYMYMYKSIVTCVFSNAWGERVSEVKATCSLCLLSQSS